MSPTRPEHAFSPSQTSTSETFVLTKHAVVFVFKLSSSPDSITATLSSPAVFIHTTTLCPRLLCSKHCCSSHHSYTETTALASHLGSTHCCSSHHSYTETTVLASHPCPYRIQNLPPHVSHLFWNLSNTHVIQVQLEDSNHSRVGILL